MSNPPWRQLLELAKEELRAVEAFLTSEGITRREIRTIIEDIEEMPKFLEQAKKEVPPKAQGALRKASLAVSRMLFDVDQMTGLTGEGLEQAQLNARKWANEARKQIESILKT